MRELIEMLALPRPYGTPADDTFVARFVAPLAPHADAFGNRMVRIGTAAVLWSCHTDTVDRRQARKRLNIAGGVVRLAGGKAGDCLGADDTAGVWIMLEMVRAKVPGLYVFHRGEERGGLGSHYIATRTPQLLDDISFAVAFDRKGTQSIITHQAGDRCCSAPFAADLAAKLALGYRPDSTGVFTDTANYMHLVPECTNLSVGYDREHGPTETLDLAHVKLLRDTMVRFDPAGLRAYRDPHEDVLLWPEASNSRTERYDEDLIGLVERHPEAVAEMLSDCGMTADDIRDYLYRH